MFSVNIAEKPIVPVLVKKTSPFFGFALSESLSKSEKLILGAISIFTYPEVISLAEINGIPSSIKSGLIVNP